MSNVRPSCMNTKSTPSYASRVSERIGSLSGRLVALPRVECRLRVARAARPSAVGAPPALCREGANTFRLWSSPLVQQSIQNQAFVQPQCFMQEKVSSAPLRAVSRPGTCRCSSKAGAIQLVSSRVATQRSWWRHPRPNPSIEGMPKRLRLLVTPHVKR
jgi:hypothetical protein